MGTKTDATLGNGANLLALALKEKVTKQISDQKVEDAIKEQQMQNADRFFETAQVHIDRAKKGELYDIMRLEQLVGMIVTTERKEAAENGGAHQDEEPGGLLPDVAEGAAQQQVEGE